jgi:hypothetical protein
MVSNRSSKSRELLAGSISAVLTISSGEAVYWWK